MTKVGPAACACMFVCVCVCVYVRAQPVANGVQRMGGEIALHFLQGTLRNQASAGRGALKALQPPTPPPPL